MESDLHEINYDMEGIEARLKVLGVEIVMKLLKN